MTTEQAKKVVEFVTPFGIVLLGETSDWKLKKAMCCVDHNAALKKVYHEIEEKSESFYRENGYATEFIE